MNAQVETVQKFVVDVVYVQPEFEELKRRFPGYVDSGYFNQWLEKSWCCKDISITEKRKVVFEYVCLGRFAETPMVLADMDRWGLRPALYEELLCFAEKYPDDQRKYHIIALGSETRDRGRETPSLSCRHRAGRCLQLLPFNTLWDNESRFLAVRK